MEKALCLDFFSADTSMQDTLDTKLRKELTGYGSTGFPI